MPTVNLSPLGGAASQFLNNNGVILSGGKLYTYAAGTTTPQATYTSVSGVTPHANPIILDSAGRVPGGEIWLIDNLIYKFTLETSTGVLLGTYDNIPGINQNLTASEITLTPSGYTTATNVQMGFDNLGSSAGTSKVGFIASGSGAVARTVQSKLRDSVSVKDFGAVGNGVADDTAAIQAALDAVYGAGGGRLYFPAGDYLVSSISKTWTSAISIEIEGASMYSVILRKIAGTTSPVLDLNTSVAPTSNYCTLKNFRVIGNAKAHDGLKITNWARFRLENIDVSACDVGLNNLGSLVFMAHNYVGRLNNTGYKADVANGVGANLIQFFGGVISANSSFAVDLGQANGFAFYGTDMSGNGTAADTNTGAVRIRSSVDDEIGTAFGSFNDCWFEANKGWTFYAENSELQLTLSNVQITGPESNRSIYIGDIRSVELTNVVCPSVGDEAQINAKNFLCFGGFIAIITDNSTVSSAVFGTRTQSAGSGIRAKQFTPRIGSSTSYGIAPGSVSKQSTAVGNVGAGQDNLMSYSLPANGFSSVGQSLRVTAWGTTANNANAKTVKLFFAGTEIATLSLTVSQANAWRLDGDIMWRSGGLATCNITVSQGGVATQFTVIATTVTAIDATIANAVQVTGEGVANDDVLQRGMLVEYMA